MFSALAKSFLKQNEEGVQRGGSCPAICLQQWDEGACWIPSVKCTVLKYSPPRSLLPGVEDVSTKRPQVDHCIQQVRMQHQPHDLLRRSSKEPRPAQHGRKPQSRSASVLVSQGLFFLMLMCLPVVSELERQSKRLVGRPKVGLTGGKSDIFSGWKTGIERWFWTRWFTLWGCLGKHERLSRFLPWGKRSTLEEERICTVSLNGSIEAWRWVLFHQTQLIPVTQLGELWKTDHNVSSFLHFMLLEYLQTTWPQACPQWNTKVK